MCKWSSSQVLVVSLLGGWPGSCRLYTNPWQGPKGQGHGEADVVKGRGQAAPPSSLPHNKQDSSGLVDVFQDGGFQPRTATYYPSTGIRFTKPEELQDGAPLGDVAYQYENFIRNPLVLKKVSEQPEENQFQPNINWFGEKQTGFLEIDSSATPRHPVLLEKVSVPLKENQFQPNSNWFGEKQTGLLEIDTSAIPKRNPVLLEKASVPLEEIQFKPNSNWYGEKQTGLLEIDTFVTHSRDHVALENPSTALQEVTGLSDLLGWGELSRKYFNSKQSSSTNSPIFLDLVSTRTASEDGTNDWSNYSFIPSDWLHSRTNLAKSSRPNIEVEDDIITIENVNSGLSGVHVNSGLSGVRPDVFTVNVQSSYSARGAEKNQAAFIV